MKVLLIDDDSELAAVMSPVLTDYSINLSSASRPQQGLQMLSRERFDVVLLDVMLPEMNGFEVCREIRRSPDTYGDVWVIFLTARSELTDLVVGLETGADDYITKPFEPRELVARIHAVRRRARTADPARASSGAVPIPGTPTQQRGWRITLDSSTLTIDPGNARIELDGEMLEATSMEFELIVALAEAGGEVVSRDDALLRIQGATVVYNRSVDALIYRLRSKIKAAGGASFIRTIRSRGYSLVGEFHAPQVSVSA